MTQKTSWVKGFIRKENVELSANGKHVVPSVIRGREEDSMPKITVLPGYSRFLRGRNVERINLVSGVIILQKKRNRNGRRM